MAGKKKPIPPAFEQSKADNDKGMKEGSKADLAADKKQMAAPPAKKPKKGK